MHLQCCKGMLCLIPGAGKRALARTDIVWLQRLPTPQILIDRIEKEEEDDDVVNVMMKNFYYCCCGASSSVLVYVVQYSSVFFIR